MFRQFFRVIRSFSPSRRQGPSRPQRLSYVRPRLEGLEDRLVLSLTPIGANAGYPYTAIVEIQATFPDHKTFVGSGAMVDSFHTLTAGHMVYSAADGGWATQMTIIPELNGNYQPFGVAHMTYERTYNTWINFSKTHPGNTLPGDYDIALVTLDRTIGNQTGWLSYGYNNNNAAFASGKILNTAGYPAVNGYSGKQMYFSSGAIAGLSSDGSAIDYYQSNITTYAGQSGSPVWQYTASNNSRIIYGVHVGGSGSANSLNFATRITQGIFNDLQNWRAADAMPRSVSAAVRSLSTGITQVVSGLNVFHLQSADGSEVAEMTAEAPSSDGANFGGETSLPVGTASVSLTTLAMPSSPFNPFSATTAILNHTTDQASGLSFSQNTNAESKSLDVQSPRGDEVFGLLQAIRAAARSAPLPDLGGNEHQYAFVTTPAAGETLDAVWQGQIKDLTHWSSKI